MTAPVQFNEASAAASATSIGVAQGSNPTVGNLNIVWVRGPGGATVTGVSDTLGNTYTARGSVIEAGTTQVLYQFTAPITTGGAANTVTADYGGSTSNRGIAVLEAPGNYDASNTGTDTGNNPTDSVAATNTSQPATVYMFSNFVQGGTPGVGSGFTNVGTAWGTIGLNGRAQYKEVTSVGSQSGNFVNAALDRQNTGVVIVTDFVLPIISVQPTDQVVEEGSTAAFATTVTGATSYQWETQAPGGGSWSNVSGGTGATADDYTTGALTRASDAGRLYRLKATNTFGDTYSNAVAAIVTKALASFPDEPLTIGAGAIGQSKVGRGLVSGNTAAVTEVATASDSSSASITAAAAITEAGSAADASTASGGAQTGSVTEAASASDAQTAAVTTAAAITEAASAGESSSYPAGSVVPTLIAAVATGASGSDGGTSSAFNTTGATQLRVVVESQINTLTNGALTDNKGNSYVIDSGPTSFGSFPGYAYVFRPSAAPAVGTGHTFTLNATGCWGSTYVEAVGPSSGGTVSVATVTNAADSSKPYTTPSITPAQDNALLLGWVGDDSTGSNVAWSWTSPSTIISGATINDHGSFWGGTVGQRTVTAAGSYSMEANNSGAGGGAATIIHSYTEVLGGGSQSASQSEPASAADSSTATGGSGVSQTDAATATDSAAAARTTPGAILEVLGAQPSSSAGNYNNDYDIDGAGTSPQTVTIASNNGKAVLLLVLGNRNEQGTPTDNQSNSYASALLRQQGYAGGLWDPYDMRVYGLATANGGASHTLSVTKTDAVRESTIVAIATTGDVIQAHSIVARAAAGAGPNYTSLSVVATGPALLVAFWSGDGGLALGSLDAAPQTGTGWTMPIGVFIEATAHIQHALAIKQVEAGTHTITWDHADNQGAILFLAAIQSSSGAAVDLIAATRSTPADRAEAAAATETGTATLATSAARVEAAAAADAPAVQIATAAAAAEPGTATDAGAAALTTSATRTEAGAAADASDGTNTGSAATVTEAASASDLQAAVATMLASVSEAGTAGDAAAAVLTAVAVAAEAAAAGHTQAAVATLIAAITEAGAGAESSDGSVAGSNSATVTEPATAGDTSVATSASSAARVESAAAADAVDATKATSAAQIDAGAAGDAAAASRSTDATRAEAAAAADSSSATSAPSPAGVVEIAVAADAASAVAALLATVLEAAAASDMVLTGGLAVASMTEAASASDFADWLRNAVAGDPRVLSIEAENRVLTITAEDRRITLNAEARTITITAAGRTRSI